MARCSDRTRSWLVFALGLKPKKMLLCRLEQQIDTPDTDLAKWS
jgi:hypothetical protein